MTNQREKSDMDPSSATADSLAKIYRDGFLTTGVHHTKIHRSGNRIVGKRIVQERISGQERQAEEVHVHVVGDCGHALPNDPYTMTDGRKVCSTKCVARCESPRCQQDVPGRELKEAGKIKVCSECYRRCRRWETVKAVFRNIFLWGDRNG